MRSKRLKNFGEFLNELESNSELQDEFKVDPVSAARKIDVPDPLKSDQWIYRIIVIGLSLTILSIIIGVIILMGKGEIDGDGQVPTILTAIGSAAIGAVAGLLVPAPREN